MKIKKEAEDGMKFFSFLILFFLFCDFSFGAEEIIVEDNGNYLQLEVVKYKSSKHQKKYKYHKKREEFYVAKKGSKVFHRPNCRFAKRIKHKVIYHSRKEALNHHLRPCKVCKP